MDLFTLVIIFICVYFGWQYTKFREIEAKISKIPGPSKVPFFGNFLMLLGNSPAQHLDMITGLARKYPQICCLMFGQQPFFLISHPKYSEVLLSSQKLIDKSLEYRWLVDWISTGLLIATGNKWFTRRRIITPAFHFKILDQFVETFDKHGDTLVEHLEKSNGKSIDVFQPIALCALDNICETAMGLDIQAQRKSDSVYVRAVKEMSVLLFKRIHTFYLRSDFIFNLSPYKKQYDKLLKILHGFTDSVIIKRREELMKPNANSNSKDDQEDVGEKKKMAFLDVLLHSNVDGKPLSNMDIREEVDTFMFEGHDTTTSGMAFCLYLLAKHPEVQKKLYEEVVSVIGRDYKTTSTTKSLNDLHYLEMVIKETLRIYPSVPGFGRTIKEDLQLGEYLIPKGSNIGINVYCMARDPTLWEDPLKFDPERFSSDKQLSHPYLFTPFSAGPRNCIGQKFAMYEMKCTISKVVRNFELSVMTGFEPIIAQELVLRPQNGIWLNLKRRTT